MSTQIENVINNTSNRNEKINKEVAIEADNCKKNIKRKMLLIFFLSFIIPSAMMMAIYLSQGITYGGKVTVLLYDLECQYLQFLSGVRYLLADPTKILFNWNYSLGGNFMGCVAYYVMSPLNILTVLWDIKDMPDAIYVLEILRIGLCGLTFQIFLHNRKLEKSSKMINILFSTCYALMSYNIAFSMNIMWTDAIVLFPLAVLGTEKILAGKKPWLYVFSMFGIFFTNYYMSYFVGCFLALYFLGNLFRQWNKGELQRAIRQCFVFGISTLIALGLAMPVLLPALMNSKYRYVDATNGDMSEFYRFPISELLVKFLPSQYDSMVLGGRPFIFCGTVILFLAICFFCQRRGWKDKVIAIAWLLLIVMGFLNQKVDYVWHGFRYPTGGFPYRYAFLFSFVILLLAHEAWDRIQIKNSTLQLVMGIAVAYTFLEIYMNGASIVAGLYKEFFYMNRWDYEIKDTYFSGLTDVLQKEEDFYRAGASFTEGKYLYLTNSGIMYGFNGVDFFSSSINNRVAKFLEYMGAVTMSPSISQQGFTPVMDSVLGIRYKIEEMDPYDCYEQVAEAKYEATSYGLFENKNALCLGCTIPSMLQPETAQWGDGPFDSQKRLLQYMGIEDSKIFHELPYDGSAMQLDEKNINLVISFVPEAKQTICYYLDMVVGEGEIDVYLDGNKLYSGEQTYIRSVHLLKDLEAGVEHQLVFSGNVDTVQGFYIAEFNQDAYEEEMQQLKKKELKNFVQDGNRLKAVFEAQEDELLMLTLGCDDGFKIFIDGVETQWKEVLHTFIGVDVPAGAHTIEIIYMPPGLIIGLWCSGISVLVVIAGLIWGRKKNNYSR